MCIRDRKYIQPNVTISYPVNGNNVNFSEVISGNSTGVYENRLHLLHLYVLINPVASNNNKWWVQPEAFVYSDGSWHVNSQFGLSAQENIGEKFWVIAEVTEGNLSEGQEVNYISGENYSTKPILLTRS